MTDSTNSIWLKVLIGFIITVLFVTVTIGITSIKELDDCKVDKEVFNQYEHYQNQQFGEIKESLTRIEEKI